MIHDTVKYYEMVEGLAELLTDIDLSLTCSRHDRLLKSKIQPSRKQKLYKIFSEIPYVRTSQHETVHYF